MNSAAIRAAEPAGAEPSHQPIDDRIAEMRRLLERTSTASTAEALGLLRDAFPDAPLDERVRALSRPAH